MKTLEPHGYSPCPNTSGIWKHRTRKTKFCLVDDFGVKYFSTQDANHLLDVLKEHYTVSVDWAGKNYCGLTFNWEYEQGYVDVSMPGYVEKTLKRLQHVKPSVPQYSPHKWTKPSYGSKLQMAPVDTSQKLKKPGIKHVQSVVGSFLYYARAIDATMLPALNDIGSQQANPTEKTLAATAMLCA